MDIEHHLICRILQERDLSKVTEYKVTSEFFADDDHARVFNFITKHHSIHGEVPLRSMVKRNWPTYKVVSVEHGMEYYLEEIKKQYMYTSLMERLDYVKEAMDERDPATVLAEFQAAITDLGHIQGASQDVILNDTWKERLEYYREIRDNGGRLRGLPTGFSTIDRATNGLQPKQFVVCIGLPKSGKSTLLLAIAKAIQEYGKRPLLIGFEMTNDEQGARYDSMSAHIDMLKLMGGYMDADMEGDLIEAGKLNEGLPDFIASADVTSATTVSGVAAKIKKFKPDICFIDGIYLMDDENGEPKGSSQALTNITRSLKRLAQQLNICIVGTTQVLASKVSRATGVQAASIGYSSSFAQDCDTLIAAETDEEDDSKQILKVLLSRNGPRVECEVRWEWETATFQELNDGVEVDPV